MLRASRDNCKAQSLMLPAKRETWRSMMNRGREEECLQTLAKLRRASPDDLLVRVEFLEVKALRLFEVETAARKYPQWQDGSFKSRFLIGFHDYLSLITNRSLFKRTIVAVRLHHAPSLISILHQIPVPAISRLQGY